MFLSFRYFLKNLKIFFPFSRLIKLKTCYFPGFSMFFQVETVFQVVSNLCIMLCKEKTKGNARRGKSVYGGP